ncbi:MAG: DUF1049 domain-containing protein [Pseudomonadales bacterium]|nr:DUF1049 domain-containing protein [Pseudomonadales bacterium]
MTWMKRFLYRLVLLVLFVVLFLIATENSVSVSLQLISLRSPALPLSWWLVGTFVLGLLIGNLWASFARWLSRPRG